MPNVIHFTTAAARLASSRAASEPPRISPARLWIEKHKPGRSRVTATHQADVVARLLGYEGVDTCPWHTLGYVDGMELPFEPPASTYLDKWLAWRGPRPGVIFTRLERGGVGVIQAMTPEAVSHILWRRGEEIGLRRVSAHALRRAFVCRILDATGDLSAAAKLARHVNVRTTATYYDTRPLESMRETMARVPWPRLAGG